MGNPGCFVTGIFMTGSQIDVHVLETCVLWSCKSSIWHWTLQFMTVHVTHFMTVDGTQELSDVLDVLTI